MPRQTKESIAKELAELRKLVEQDDDQLLSRVAQAMETAIIWATEATTGWDSMAGQACKTTQTARNEMRNRI